MAMEVETILLIATALLGVHLIIEKTNKFFASIAYMVIGLFMMLSGTDTAEISLGWLFFGGGLIKIVYEVLSQSETGQNLVARVKRKARKKGPKPY